MNPIRNINSLIIASLYTFSNSSGYFLVSHTFLFCICTEHILYLYADALLVSVLDYDINVLCKSMLTTPINTSSWHTLSNPNFFICIVLSGKFGDINIVFLVSVSLTYRHRPCRISDLILLRGLFIRIRMISFVT